MFYADRPGKILRMGDVVSGYISAVPNQKEPFNENFADYSLDIKHPVYLVVLTPCCSIGEKTISLAPLETIIDAGRKKFFSNPKFKQDMTLINSPRTIEEWRELGHQDITGENDGKSKLYAFDNFFIYAEDSHLVSYDVTVRGENFKSRYYLIDFRNACKMKCNCIVAETERIQNREPLLEKAASSKILELSIESRACLREKLAFYYRRIPKEDLIVQY
jgi:hypothetical protein